MSEPIYTREDRSALLEVARLSLEHGLAHGFALSVQAERYSPALQELRASFVTLRLGGALRGCTGRLAAEDRLVRDVAHNAYRSGFHDPRFPPLVTSELPALEIHVSVLSPPAPLPCGSEVELLAALRPGEDGLVLHEGVHMATFLPAVWQTLPDPVSFVRELKRKAGLAPEAWSDQMRFERYRVVEIGAD